MQHSQLRKISEDVKLFAKVSSQQSQDLKVFEFNNGNLVDITPNFQIDTLNPGYYSTTITTPNHNCYLVIQFCGNPIILRVGKPDLQFFFWAPKQKTYTFTHFDEYGVKLNEGELNSLGRGFYYTTPISDVLGYIEVLGKPYVIHVPYCSDLVGVGINVDWRKTIIHQRFGIQVKTLNFKLNKIVKREFQNKTLKHFFKKRFFKKKFDLKIIKQNFKVHCKN